MPSEKSRYLNRNGGPPAPIDFTELKANLSHLGIERLIGILWTCSQRNDILRKTLMNLGGDTTG